jgi:hypothetical protein
MCLYKPRGCSNTVYYRPFSIFYFFTNKKSSFSFKNAKKPFEYKTISRKTHVSFIEQFLLHTKTKYIENPSIQHFLLLYLLKTSIIVL